MKTSSVLDICVTCMLELALSECIDQFGLVALVQSRAQPGEQSQIPWAYSPKVVRTNEIVRITQHFPYKSTRTFFEQVWHKMF